MSTKAFATIALSAATLVLGLAVISCSRSSDEATGSASGPVDRIDEQNTLSPGQAAMRATIDPETGRLRVEASAGELTLDPGTLEALRRDTQGLQEVHHPDGSVSVDLQGRFQSASVARIGEDGRLVICTDQADQATETLNPPASESGTQQPEVQ